MKRELKPKVISLYIIYIGCCCYSFVCGRAFVKYSSDEVAIILVRSTKLCGLGLRSYFLLLIIKFSFIWRRNIPSDTNAEGIYKYKLMTKNQLIKTTKDMRVRIWHQHTFLVCM